MRHLGLSIIALFLPISIYCQSVSINKSGDPPFPGAILDIQSDSAGVLLPRTDISSIFLPSEGMVIYDTIVKAFYYYRGLEWVRLVEYDLFQYFYADRDGDGYGDRWNVVYSLEAPPGFESNSLDCNDTEFSM